MYLLSLEYLLFAAAVFFAYYLTPRKGRWLVLLAASLFFYGASGWKGLVYLLAVALITYGAARCITRKKGMERLCVLILVLSVCLGAMAILKYSDAFLLHWNRKPLFAQFQPLGLSWFTFQSVGYVVDVYRGKVKPEGNLLKYLLFVCFFPQMSQGPISTFSQLAPQLTQGHPLEPTGVTMGFQRMLWGFFKKMVLADRLAPVTAWLLSDGEKPGGLVLLGAGLYMLRLYGDFSGGMDIICGTAMTLGISMPENFRQPFFCGSVAEYWRRWHISLGAWFRSYVLYPFTTSSFSRWLTRVGGKLLGKKIGRLLPSALGTLLVFLLIGVWHGAHRNAVLYGLYFGVLMGGSLLLDGSSRKLKKRLAIRERSPLWKGFCTVRTWLLLLAAQFFAFTDSPAQAFSLMKLSVVGWGRGNVGESLLAIMPAGEWILALGAGALLTVVDALCYRGVEVNRRLARGPALLRWGVLLALIVGTVVFGCYGQGANSFVYTQF